MQPINLKRNDLIYPELSFNIIGCAFEVFNELGPGHSEKNYQKAMSVMFTNQKIPFKEQVYFPLYFKEKLIGKSFLDYLVDEKIIVDLKKNAYFSKTNIEQVLGYLKLTNLQLAILINFSTEGVLFKRVVNIIPKQSVENIRHS